MPLKDPEKLKAYKRQWYEANIEAKKAYDKARRIAKAEELSIQRKAKYAENAEARRAYSRNYYHANREQILAQYQLKRDTDPEYRHQRSQETIQWQKDNPDKVAQKSETRRARKLNQFIEDVNPTILYEMHGGMCGICKEFIDLTQGKMHIEHIIPLSKGGMHGYVNTQPSHPICNLRKGSKYANS